MSVTGVAQAILQAERVYPELPLGIFPWVAVGTVTGDGTGGTANVDISMHPGSASTFTLYVALAKSAVKTSVAANTGRITVRIAAVTDWEWDYRNAGVLDTLNPQVTTAATVEKEDEHQHLQYLGRTNPGLPGGINIATINVDTMIMGIRLVGFYSDRPFIPHNDWRL